MFTSKKIQVYPSILSADFGHLADEAKRIEDAGADAIHVDVMDGHFVPNLTIGPAIVAALNRETSLFLDVHLMMYGAYEYVERFVQAGADRLTIHFEASEDFEETLRYIHKCNVEAGLSFNPETSAEFIPKYLPECDFLLLMAVHPGFGGQHFMPEVLEKIAFCRQIADKMGKKSMKEKEGKKEKKEKGDLSFPIAVDGGINPETAKQCLDAGANVLISGQYLFHECEDMALGIRKLKGE